MQKPFTEGDMAQHPKLNTVRIVEAVIIGLIVSLVSTSATAYITLQIIGAKVEHLSAELKSLSSKHEADRHALAQLQISTVGIQARLVEVQSATNQRLLLIERKVFNLP